MCLTQSHTVSSRGAGNRHGVFWFYGLSILPRAKQHGERKGSRMSPTGSVPPFFSCDLDESFNPTMPQFLPL